LLGGMWIIPLQGIQKARDLVHDNLG
jgi:hypothetical protein